MVGYPRVKIHLVITPPSRDSGGMFTSWHRIQRGLVYTRWLLRTPHVQEWGRRNMSACPASTLHWHNVVLLLGQRRKQHCFFVSCSLVGVGGMWVGSAGHPLLCPLRCCDWQAVYRSAECQGCVDDKPGRGQAAPLWLGGCGSAWLDWHG